ncbi:exported hypothetical protein [Verrucomicrobia bacterium]|nr:exported hypothetical protein [Verrucomicrobiota bacterium]
MRMCVFSGALAAVGSATSVLVRAWFAGGTGACGDETSPPLRSDTLRVCHSSLVLPSDLVIRHSSLPRRSPALTGNILQAKSGR